MGADATPKERMDFMIKQMKDGIAKWWEKNKTHVIVGLIAGLATGAILTVLTGGAILSAVPPLLQILGSLMAAKGAFDISKWIAGYATKSFDGDVTGGSKNLARGMAAGAIELLFSTIFFGMGAAFKGIKSVAKNGVKGAVKSGLKSAKAGIKGGIKSVRNGMKGGVKGMAKNGMNAAKNGVKSVYRSNKEALGALKGALANSGKAAWKNGKLVLGGIKNGVVKGAKTLDGLGKRIGKWMKFRKFRLRIGGRRWTLEGKVNPYVKLASGQIMEVDYNTVKGKKKGDMIEVDGQRAEVLTPDIRKVDNVDDWMKVHADEKLIGTLKGKGLDDADIMEFMEALPNANGKALGRLKKELEQKVAAKGGTLSGKEMNEILGTKTNMVKNMRGSFDELQTLKANGDLTPHQVEDLLDVMHKNHRKLKVEDDLLELKAKEMGIDFGADNIGSVGRNNFKNLMRRLEESDLPSQDRQFLIDYIKENPQGFRSYFRDPDVDLQDIVNRARTQAAKGTGTGRVIPTKLTPKQVDDAVAEMIEEGGKNVDVLKKITDGKKMADLPPHRQKILQYIMQVRSTGDDYLSAIRKAGLGDDELKQIIDSLEEVSSNHDLVRSGFRKKIREAVVDKLGNSVQGLDDLNDMTKGMATNNRGQFFEDFAKKVLPGQKGGIRTDVSVGGKSYIPDNITSSGKSYEFTEFKDVKSPSLDMEEFAKIKAYAKAIEDGTELSVNGTRKPLTTVKYVFSNRQMYEYYINRITKHGKGHVKLYYLGSKTKGGTLELLP